MTGKPTPPEPERAATDEHLRIEREQADTTMAKVVTVAEDAAEVVLERARVLAENVLATARQKEDSGQNGPDHDVANSRRVEDTALEVDRVAAEARVRRAQERASLAALVPHERHLTDRSLLTERDRSDAAVAHRDDFLGIVSHDLRNLLGGMAVTAEVLAMEASESEEGRRAVEATKTLRRYIARMNRLVGDLIDVSSIDAGLLAIHPHRCDAGAILQEAIDAFAPVAAEKGLSITAEGVEQSLVADLDHDRIFQVLTNLITNAIKFTPAGGAVKVGGVRTDDALEIFVRDTGRGIPTSMLESVFERFWQVGKSDTRGVGLGLYISQCIVQIHGGTIWAESTVGAGSTFRFTVPIHQPRPTSVLGA